MNTRELIFFMLGVAYSFWCQSWNLPLYGEIQESESGKVDRQYNLLKNAPYTAASVVKEPWDRPYSRERAAFPAPWTREHKYWPPVGHIDNVWGDRNFVCICG
jgi:glycine dehydrogenase